MTREEITRGIRAALKPSRKLSGPAGRALALVAVSRDTSSVNVGRDTGEASPAIVAAAQGYAGVLDRDLCVSGGAIEMWSGTGLPLAMYADALDGLPLVSRRMTEADAARVLGELMTRPSRTYLYEAGALDASALADLDRCRRIDGRTQDGFGPEERRVGLYFGERMSALAGRDFMVSPKRKGRGVMLASWSAALQGIPGVEVMLSEHVSRLRVRADVDGVEELRARLGSSCNIERVSG